MPMKAELKEKWIEALRSREFKQTQETLKRDLGNNKFGHCCLGVLHEITDGSWHPSETWPDEFDTGKKPNKDSSESSLKGKYSHGLTQGECDKLADLNDNRGYKFYQIANWIEKNIKTKN